MPSRSATTKLKAILVINLIIVAAAAGTYLYSARALFKQAYSPTEFYDSQIEQETKKGINSALNAQLFRRITSEEDIVRSEFVISYKRSTYEKFRQEYLDNSSSDKAYAETVEEFRRIKGIKSLPDFWRKP